MIHMEYGQSGKLNQALVSRIFTGVPRRKHGWLPLWLISSPLRGYTDTAWPNALTPNHTVTTVCGWPRTPNQNVNTRIRHDVQGPRDDHPAAEGKDKVSLWARLSYFLHKYLTGLNFHPGSVYWVLACEPKDNWFDSQLGYMPGFWARSPTGDMWEATCWCISYTSMFLSLSFSLPSHLSKNK